MPESVRVPVPRATVPPEAPLRLERVSEWLLRRKLPPLTVRAELEANWPDALSLTVPPFTVRPPSTEVPLRFRMPEFTVVVPV